MGKVNVIYPAVFLPVLLAGGILSFTGNGPRPTDKKAEVEMATEYRNPAPEDIKILLGRSERYLSGIEAMERKLSRQGILSRSDWDQLMTQKVLHGQLAAHYNEQVAHLDEMTLLRNHLPMAMSERVP